MVNEEKFLKWYLECEKPNFIGPFADDLKDLVIKIKTRLFEKSDSVKEAILKEMQIIKADFFLANADEESSDFASSDEELAEKMIEKLKELFTPVEMEL